jgi:hypothetical protein
VRRELPDYGLTGADRVPSDAQSAIGRAYRHLSRLIDLGGARLYHRERSGQLSSQVALLSPLAAVLSGNGDADGPAVRYIVGSALAAATPRLALCEGLEPRELRNLLTALGAGFGPVGDRREGDAEGLRLAEDLWHLVSATTERRLRELCDKGELRYESAIANARRARRRAGLFACGDLATAMRLAAAELELAVPLPLDASSLSELCREPHLADLFDLAIQPEFARARWSRAPFDAARRR